MSEPSYPENESPRLEINSLLEIKLTNVTVSLSQSDVLQDISLELRERRIGIIGHNGSGKSTLLRLLNGLILPTKGDVSVGPHMTRDKNFPMARLVGFIFQNPDHQIIFPTVEEELGFGLEELGYSRAQARTRVSDYLAQKGRSEWASWPVSELSEGQKQLVCIDAVLLMEPQTMIFDEPFSSLDVPTQRMMRKLMDQLPQRVITVSHDLAIFENYDRLIWLDNGRIVKDGAPFEITDAYLNSLTESSGS